MTLLPDAREDIIIGARRKKLRVQILAALCLVLAYSMASHAARAGDLDTVIAFNIEAQTLDKALLEFGAQAHIQIMFASNAETRRLPGPQLRGKYTGREALRILLKGTQLAFANHGDTVEITPTDDPQSNPLTHSQPVSDPAPYAFAVSHNLPRPNVAQTDDTSSADDTAHSSVLQEVIVTAQKRQQRDFDVPISLAVFDSQTLQRLQITSLQDLQLFTPGLTVQGGGAQSRITVRGVSNLFGAGASVGEYIDEADITPTGYVGNLGYTGFDARMYDLQRMEVLRGPQGTLFGDGAMGGVIRFITNKPVLSRFEMSADVNALFTQDGAPSQRTEAMINVPLVPDTLGLRFAGEFDHEGGWIDQPAADAKNINEETLTDLRLQALWTPAPQLALNVMEIIHRSAYGLSEAEDENGNFAEVASLTVTPHATESYSLSNLTVSYQSAIAQVLSSTTYYSNALDLINRGFTFYDLSDLELFTAKSPYNTHDFSQELRLSSAAHGPFYWSLGGFYKNQTNGYADPDGELIGFSGPSGPLLPFAINKGYIYGSRSRSSAAFGDASYEMFRRLTIGAGVRYFSDKESESQNIGTPPYATASFTSTDPRFFAQYRVTSHINTYISAAKGFRSGGFNSIPGIAPYGPEDVWTYELGTKMRLLDHHLDLDADVFDSEYLNYVMLGLQTFNQIPTSVYRNAGRARIRGGEASVTLRPDDLWTLSLTGDYLNAKFVEITIPGAPYHDGEPLDLVPKYSFNISLERSFQLGDRSGYLRSDYAQVGRMRYAEVPPFVGESDVIHTLNFDSGIDWNANLRFGLYVQNLLNDRGYLLPFSIESTATRPRPRTLGVHFTVNFE